MQTATTTSGHVVSAASRALIDELFPVDVSVFGRLAERLAEVADTGAAPCAEGYTVLTPDWSINDARDAKTISHSPTVSLFRDGAWQTLSGTSHVGGRWRVPEATDENLGIVWSRWTSETDRARDEASAAAWERFRTRADQAEDRARKNKDKRTAEAERLRADPRAVPKPSAKIPEHVAAKQLLKLRRRSDTHHRMQEFVHESCVEIADRIYKPFSESFLIDMGNGQLIQTGLRTRLDVIALQLYSQRLPKGAEYGNDKASVAHPGETGISPLDLRDKPYLTIGWREVRGQVAIDLDTNWPSLEALWAALKRKLGNAMPNLIVYRLSKDGEIERPHLIWILPPGSEVGVCGKSRSAPIRTYNAVQRALASHLIDMGADAGHRNGKTKNPLAAYWSVACNDDRFCTLKEIAAALPTFSTNEKEMKRRQAKFQNVDPADVSSSMRDWNESLRIMNFEISRAFRAHCPEFTAARGSREAMFAWTRKNVAPRVLAEVGDTPRVRRILYSQMEWRAEHRPSPRTRYYDGDNRGRDRDAQKAAGLVGAELPDDRKAQGDRRQELAGSVTRAVQRDATVDAIVEVLVQAYGDTLPDDEAAIIRTVIQSKVRSPSTVYARIEAAVSRFRDASRYIASLTSPESNTVIQTTDQPVIDTVTQPFEVRITHSSLPKATVTPVGGQPAVSGERPATPVFHPHPVSDASPRRNPDQPCRRFIDIGEDFIDEAIEVMKPCYDDERRRATRRQYGRTVH